MTDKIVFGYWGVRGLGQVARLLLAYTGAVWEDVKYTAQEQWFGKDRTTVGLDFPNLPYIIDGDFKLSESSAIVRYIINRSGKKDLLGKDLRDAARVDSVNGVINDIKAAIGPLFWSSEWEKTKDAALEKLRPKFEQLQTFIGNKDFVFGYLTLADFNISEFSHYIEKISPDDYKKFEFWGRIRKNFESLPEIKAYYEK